MAVKRQNFVLEVANDICNEVCHLLGRGLTSVEQDAVHQISRSVIPDPKIVKGLLVRYYAKKIVDVIKDQKKPADLREYNIQVLNEQEEPDKTKQEIKAEDSYYMREIKIVDFLNFGDLTGYQLSKQINPLSRMRYNYVFLDTSKCYSRTDYVFKWLLNDKIKVKQTGVLPTQGALRNIRMARIGLATFANFIPPAAAPVKNQKRIGFDFEEFRAQGHLMGPQTAQFFMHFRDISYLDDNNYIVSPFDHIRGWFRFHEPIKELPSLTLKMFDTSTFQDLKVNSDDTVTFSGIQQFGITTGAVTDGGIIPAAADHFYLSTNGLPLISTVKFSGNLSRQVDMENAVFAGFTTDDPVTDAAVIAAYNTTRVATYRFAQNANGRYFLTSNLLMRTDPHVDISTITYGGTEIPIQVTFPVLAKPRVNFVMELISEDDSENVDI